MSPSGSSEAVSLVPLWRPLRPPPTHMPLVAATPVVLAVGAIGDVAIGAIIAGVFTLVNTGLNLYFAYAIRRLETRHDRARKAANEATSALTSLMDTRDIGGNRGVSDA